MKNIEKVTSKIFIDQWEPAIAKYNFGLNAFQILDKLNNCSNDKELTSLFISFTGGFHGIVSFSISDKGELIIAATHIRR